MPKFFQELYREIDQLGDKNGKVTPAELQSALRDPALRERWSKLIAYHPTEWQAKSNEPKWSVLEDLLRENYEAIKKQSGSSNIQLINNLLNSTRELFRHEKERIDNLVFWNELERAMQVTLPKQVYHFHPISFIEAMKSGEAQTPSKSGWAHSVFANLLGRVESRNDYSSYNRTYPAPAKSFYDTHLTSLTVLQVQQEQKERRMFATGRFQIIPDTLSAAIKHLNIDTSLNYDAVMQDKIFNEYLIKVKRKLS
jgi:hypothetical protein